MTVIAPKCRQGCERDATGALVPCATCTLRYHASMARLFEGLGHEDLARQHRALAKGSAAVRLVLRGYGPRRLAPPSEV